MSQKVVRVVLLFAFVFGSTSVGMAQKLHPKLKSKEKTFQTLHLMPPKVSLLRDTVKGGESMLKEAEVVEKSARKLVYDDLKAKGFNVIESQISADSANNNDELRYAFADIQGKYDQLQVKIKRLAP